MDDLRINNLSYSYPAGRKALDSIELTVEAGSKVAVIGPNGAGKSTLLLHLNGILRGAGSVAIAGQEISPRSLRTIRSLVGVVFQDPDDQLFSPTVFDDVAFGPLHMGLPADEIRLRVSQALDDVDMSGFEQEMPHQLSLGEKKRIAIATVLAMNPRILVLDEPSAGLDPRTRRNLIRLLGDLPQTMIIASHDMRLVWDLCPDAVILDGGRVVAAGATRELLSNEALMEKHGLESLLPTGKHLVV